MSRNVVGDAPPIGLEVVDRSTIDAARAGDERAWRVVYRALAPALRGYFRATTSLPADDLVEDVMVRVVRSIRTFDGDGEAFRAWAFAIAHNLRVDVQRAAQRQPAVLAAGHDELHELPTPGDDLFAVSDSNDRIHSLLGKLTPAQRDVIVLRIVDDFTVEQVAEALHLRPGAVKALQRRALHRLRHLLDDEYVSDTGGTDGVGAVARGMVSARTTPRQE